MWYRFRKWSTVDWVFFQEWNFQNLANLFFRKCHIFGICTCKFWPILILVNSEGLMHMYTNTHCPIPIYLFKKNVTYTLCQRKYIILWVQVLCAALGDTQDHQPITTMVFVPVSIVTIVRGAIHQLSRRHGTTIMNYLVLPLLVRSCEHCTTRVLKSKHYIGKV